MGVSAAEQALFLDVHESADGPGEAFKPVLKFYQTGTSGAEIQLRDALKAGNMQMVAQLINSRSFDINWVDKQNGWSFLHYAVSTDGGLPAIEHLIKAGIDPRLTNKEGETAIEMFNTRYTKALQDNGYNIEYIKTATGAARWVLDKATDEIRKIAEGGMGKVGDFMEVNKWVEAGGSLIPIMPKVSLFDVLHLRPENQVHFVKDILGNDSRVQAMIDKGEIKPDDLMGEKLNGVTPYQFFKRMADSKDLPEADRKRFHEIADVLKSKAAPGSYELPPEAPHASEYRNITAVSSGDEPALKVETKDRTYIVYQQENPALYAHAAAVMSVLFTDGDRKKKLSGLLGAGFHLIDRDGQLDLSLGKAKFLDDKSDIKNGIIAYRFNDKNYVVEKTIDARYYAYVDGLRRLQASADQINRPEAEGGLGYERVTASSRFNPDDIRPDSVTNKVKLDGKETELPAGMLLFETKDGKKFSVVKEENEGVFYTVTSMFETRQRDKATRGFRETSGLDVDLNSLNIFDARTTEKGDDGEFLTVSDYIGSKQIAEYKKLLEDKKITMDDPRAQYYMALSAKHSTINLIPYAETFGNPFNDSTRDVKDPIALTEKDRAALIKMEEIDQKLQKLSLNDVILADSERFLKEGIDKVEDKDKIKDKILSTVRDEKFVDYLINLQKNNSISEAQYVQGQLLSSLRYLVDEKEYTAVVADLERTKLIVAVDGLVGEPDKITEETLKIAGKDILQWMINAGRIGTVGGMHSSWAFESFLKEYVQGRKSPTDIAKTLLALDKEALTSKLPEAQFQAKVNAAMEKAFVPVADRQGLLGVFGQLNKFGALGTMAAGLTLLSGIYQSTGANKPAASWDERFMIAKEFLLFMSFSGSMGRFAGNILEKLGRPGLVEAFGLGKSLPEIWGKDGTYAKYVKPAEPDMAEFVSKLTASSELVDSSTGTFKHDAKIDEAIKNAPPELRASLEELMSKDAARMGLSGKAFKPSTWKLALGSTINVFANLADAAWGGVEIAQGVNLLRNAKTPQDKAEAAFRFIYGGFAGSAGVIGSGEALGLFNLSMFSRVAGFVSRLPSVFFLAGIAFSAIGFIFGLVKRQQNIDRITNEQTDWFRNLDKMGLMRSDWHDKLEYARYSFYWHNARHAPDDKDYWSFQQEEYDHFRNAEVPEWGDPDSPIYKESSLWRLDRTKHIYPKDGGGWGKKDFSDTVVNDRDSGLWGYYDENGNYVDQSHLEGFAGPG
jgi:hypothetical protein